MSILSVEDPLSLLSHCLLFSFCFCAATFPFDILVEGIGSLRKFGERRRLGCSYDSIKSISRRTRASDQCTD
ncbi:uncharacterized protein K444DRAFT_379124 [Hyaloscypha bicolor E]|uniref:Uncharacterized protein n=1 Tax=Hyaloscypha bicolor E TaxID=1095630 RepID=A0A2J6TFG2_9HELO|nr:uncharacterized protein K444DRAFT_379124 [Hyaloscypha bicolor E]PMD61756.1 hypothetical protein K444DRAFT_379124 [Hyaloscypha bicolor E]